MAKIQIDWAAMSAMFEAAKKYGLEHKLATHEMGAAVLGAGMALASTTLNNVQLEQLLAHLFDLTAPMRKRSSS